MILKRTTSVTDGKLCFLTTCSIPLSVHLETDQMSSNRPGASFIDHMHLCKANALKPMRRPQLPARYSNCMFRFDEPASRQ